MIETEESEHRLGRFRLPHEPLRAGLPALCVNLAGAARPRPRVRLNLRPSFDRSARPIGLASIDVTRNSGAATFRRGGPGWWSAPGPHLHFCVRTRQHLTARDDRALTRIARRLGKYLVSAVDGRQQQREYQGHHNPHVTPTELAATRRLQPNKPNRTSRRARHFGNACRSNWFGTAAFGPRRGTLRFQRGLDAARDSRLFRNLHPSCHCGRRVAAFW